MIEICANYMKMANRIVSQLTRGVCFAKYSYVPGSDSGDILFLPCLFVCLLDNFNIGYQLWTLSDRTFIFVM